MGYTIHAMDVNSAFLQEKATERNVFLEPPGEENNIMAYGLIDASRN